MHMQIKSHKILWESTATLLSFGLCTLWVGLCCFDQSPSVRVVLLFYSYCRLWSSSSWFFCFSSQVWIPSLCCVLSLSKASVPKGTSVSSLMTSLWRGNVRKEACMWMAETMSWRKASLIVFLYGCIFSTILCALIHKIKWSCTDIGSIGFWNWHKWNRSFCFSLM